ncbi:MAG: XRE family transcriptional regulator [Herbinix sp.]|nr:XRE family transcriptional regulator [Herbinix sp.]
MNIQLLRELKLYIEKHINDDIIIKETETMDYIMPMRSAFRIDTAHKDEALSNDKKKDDGKWLEQFRRKSIPKVKERQDTSYSRSLIHEEEGLEDYINKEKSNETFSTKLLLYIDRSKLSDSYIYKKAGIDRRHFSKIRCDIYYQPKKATAIALCMALKLNLEETVELLGMAGYSLSSSDTGDLVIKFCIEREIYDLTEVNEALDYFGQKLLGVVG